MKIIFIGTVEFSYHCLQEVLNNNGNVVGIITSPPTRTNSDYKDLTSLAQHYHIPSCYCKKINDPNTIEWIKNLQPDIIFCWGWSQIIKSELLSIPPLGILGVHPALLPENRGRHPLIWARILGLKESGLTFFFMDEGADSGPILSQKKFSITPSDTAATLYNKIKHLASQQIAEFLPQLCNNTYESIPQDHSRATYWRKRSMRDGLIDWRMSTEAILNLIHALSKPYPGAHCPYKNETFTVWDAYTYPKLVASNIEPGKIIMLIDDAPVIKCYNGALVLTEYEPSYTTFAKGDYLL